MNAQAGPSTSHRRFVSAQNRPEQPDGIFRVVIISSGSVASVKIPEIVGALAKDTGVAVQVVATEASLHFYSQEQVDEAVDKSGGTVGVKVWTDDDEWSGWTKIGDPILHIELRRWADLVVVAPCSADMLAKIAGGLCDNLATSLLRALSPSTPTIICPAMNTYMYSHPLTADHLKVAQEKLGYLISGPQNSGRLACGDEGSGKMTDWRDIVSMIQHFGTVYRQKTGEVNSRKHSRSEPDSQAHVSPKRARGPTPPTPGKVTSPLMEGWRRPSAPDEVLTKRTPVVALGSRWGEIQPGDRADGDRGVKKPRSPAGVTSDAHWRSMTNGLGGDGSFWDKKWWIG